MQPGKTVEQLIEEASASIKEKLELGRYARFEGGYVDSYLHRSDRDLPPTLGVLVQLDKPSEAVAKDLAQQIAAMRPGARAPAHRQVYVDTGGIEAYWDPMFDARIDIPAPAGEALPTPGLKFLIDPQTRIVTPNPAWKNATEALAKLWGSALFDCGPEDYEYMVRQCIKWGRAAKKAEAQPL